MRVDVRPRKRNAPRPAHKSAPGYLAWLRKRECACNGRNPGCGGKMEAAHVDYAAKGTPDAKGMSSKVADKWTIPLTANCHRLQTDKGWPWFDITMLNMAGAGEAKAREYWRLWPGRVKWEAKNV